MTTQPPPGDFMRTQPPPGERFMMLHSAPGVRVTTQPLGMGDFMTTQPPPGDFMTTQPPPGAIREDMLVYGIEEMMKQCMFWRRVTHIASGPERETFRRLRRA
jgi:hypothetical protein